MTIIAGKPFTQFLNLNVLDELRVQGVLITPGGSPTQVIQEPTGNYNVTSSDDIVAFTVASDSLATLISAASAGKQVRIKNHPSSTANVTITPDGADTIELQATRIVSPGQSFTIFPVSGGWLIG